MVINLIVESMQYTHIYIYIYHIDSTPWLELMTIPYLATLKTIKVDGFGGKLTKHISAIVLLAFPCLVGRFQGQLQLCWGRNPSKNQATLRAVAFGFDVSLKRHSPTRSLPTTRGSWWIMLGIPSIWRYFTLQSCSSRKMIQQHTCTSQVDIPQEFLGFYSSFLVLRLMVQKSCTCWDW